jgi:hypothetical protein
VAQLQTLKMPLIKARKSWHDEATPNLDAYLLMKQFMDLDENWRQRQTIDKILMNNGWRRQENWPKRH